MDSGGLIAIHVRDDEHHAAAIRCRDETLRYSRLYTSSAVVAETVAHIQRNNLLDPQNLDSLISDFLKPEKWIAFLPIGDDVLKKSFQMVRDRHDRRFSLVDATNIALMEKHHIDYIFTFDGLFDGVAMQRGYNLRYIQRVCI